jgi:WD40 repeat protein
MLARGCLAANIVSLYLLGIAGILRAGSSGQAAPGDQVAKSEAAADKTIRALVADLSDDSFENRDLAQKRLAAVGEPALELLRQAASDSNDVEVRERASQLVRQIENSCYPFVWSARGHNTRPNRIVLTPDGKNFVSSGYETLCMGEVATGKVTLTFGKGPGYRYYQDVAVFADGKRAFVAADDKIARLFDLRTGNELRQFIGHQAGIKGVALLPGEKRVITGSKDKSLRLWDVEAGTELAQFPGVTEAVRSLALSPDGRTLAVGHHGDGKEPSGTVRLWNVETRQEMRELAGHTREVTRVAFSTDGKQLVSSSFDRTVRIWEVATGKELKRFECGSLMECAYFVDRDRRVLCSGKETELTVQLWDIQDGKRLLRSPVVEDGSRDLAPLKNGGAAVAAGVDGFVRLWRWQK